MNISIDMIIEMRKLHEEGWSLRAIGKEFGMGAESIKWYMGRYLDYKPADLRKRKEEEKEKALMDMISSGENKDKIVKTLGVSKATIYRRIKAKNYED